MAKELKKKKTQRVVFVKTENDEKEAGAKRSSEPVQPARKPVQDDTYRVVKSGEAMFLNLQDQPLVSEKEKSHQIRLKPIKMLGKTEKSRVESKAAKTVRGKGRLASLDLGHNKLTALSPRADSRKTADREDWRDRLLKSQGENRQ